MTSSRTEPLHPFFESVLEPAQLLHDAESLAAFATDETHEHHYLPNLVVKPKNAAEIASILKICHEHRFPVVPRGAGSGVSGGALASQGGVMLCMEKLNRILEINTRNQTVTVEAGAITGEVQTALLEQGLWLPPDPGSKDWCQIGGNLAEMAAGPKSLKYGAFRDYVLDLEVVLADGRVIRTGSQARKSATGYNLTQLMLGSEGTLGIITKVVFRLIPPPAEHLLLRLAFDQMDRAIEAMGQIFEAGLHPCEMEFLGEDGIQLTQAFCQSKPMPHTKAYVWIGFDGHDSAWLLEQAQQAAAIAEDLGAMEVLLGENEAQKKDLWEYRHQVGLAIIETTPFRDVDLCVPRDRLGDTVRGVKAIGQRFGFRTIVFGHAGDGNLHVHVCRDDLSEDAWQTVIHRGIRDIYALVAGMNGALSGEHGVGLVLRQHLDLSFSPSHLALLRQIKAVFDPRGILNPGKIFPDAP